MATRKELELRLKDTTDEVSALVQRLFDGLDDFGRDLILERLLAIGRKQAQIIDRLYNLNDEQRKTTGRQRVYKQKFGPKQTRQYLCDRCLLDSKVASKFRNDTHGDGILTAITEPGEYSCRMCHTVVMVR